MRDERGFTLIELLVSIASFIILLGVIMMMTVAAVRNQERVTDRVAANQNARPAMTQIIDALHSSCFAPRVAPVLVGSNNTSISFQSKSGSAVTPTPDTKIVTLSGGNLTMVTDPPVGATTQRVLATNVSAPGNVVFRYYNYVNGQLSTTPLSTVPSGLTSTNASLTARVAVSFTVRPGSRASDAYEAQSPITLTDAADLRLESAAQVTAQENRPCT